MKTKVEITMLLDFKVLREQKLSLLSLSNSQKLEGLINLIDHIQDYSVDVLNISENKVFGRKVK